MSVKRIIKFLGMNNTKLERKILIILDFENGFLPTYLPQWATNFKSFYLAEMFALLVWNFSWWLLLPCLRFSQVYIIFCRVVLEICDRSFLELSMIRGPYREPKRHNLFKFACSQKTESSQPCHFSRIAFKQGQTYLKEPSFAKRNSVLAWKDHPLE